MLYRLSALTSVLAALPVSTVLGGQIPVVNGVIGGVNSRPLSGNGTDQFGILPAATTPGKLRVTENSGVCETTEGVYQASGYGDLTSKESIYFWFFEARNNSDPAPLSVWLNGGVSAPNGMQTFLGCSLDHDTSQPGSSSMIGLFQVNGPCRIKNDSSGVTLNPNSWNEVSNMSVIIV